ncbi:putative ribosomal RNA small subunit methyltransferase B [Candidatus Sulfotelmatomonas gaucii]|uniref:Putative ribosomal RNA small subunit methyltransferase B n=1 Tax=Candidatus Sulfuritelmatomonas gaucii TaxID=2043161 RepID=A0A2N9LAD2_9BACT|nr:putative ribosomal RNA small subunit methyltransferase B [Candidatus Sulfotelmatomonas gaucii]
MRKSACGRRAAGLSAVAGISASRKAAFDILMAVERGKAHSDALLRGKAVSVLSLADRNLTTTLVLGVLRWQIRLDAEIRKLLKKPNAKLDAEVLIALRLGALQLLHLERIPAHAAIGESVELAKQAGHRFAAGMVNAVLRGIARGGAAHLEVPQGTADELALAEAHPSWMVERWAEFYGLDAARAICRHAQVRRPVSVRVEDADAEAEVVRDGILLGPGELLTAARTVISGDVTATAAFQAGRVRIQDEGSQFIGELAACAGRGVGPNPKRIVDLCAAPGGKTLILAERNPEAQIVACESNARRLEELRERVAPYAGRIECRLADAAELEEGSAFDVALADVPCSGTGTLGRNPEIRHRLRLEDLARHAERQRAILRAALRAVRPGGCVVYSTCSLEPEENEQVVAGVLAENRNVRQISAAAGIASLLDRGILRHTCAERLAKCVTPEGALRLLPGVFQTDGFFAALIERIA